MGDAILERMKDLLSKLYSEYRPYEGRDAFDGYQDELEHGIRELLAQRSNEVYVALIKDRHVDTMAYVFLSLESAIACCENELREASRGNPDWIVRQEIRGWDFYGRVEDSCTCYVYKTDIKP